MEFPEVPPKGWCCATHSRSYDGSGIKLASAANDDCWVVLIGGEHRNIVAKDARLGTHCSVNWIGRAYADLVDHVGRDRIIVMGQIQETLDWLTTAARTGTPEFTKGASVAASKAGWAEKLAVTVEATRRLVADGGADYDGKEVTPHNAMRILLGVEEEGGGRVLPKGAGRSVLLGIYSHGWSHEAAEDHHAAQIAATKVCDLCEDVHAPDSVRDHAHSSLASREWFIHFPYEHPNKSELVDTPMAHAFSSGHTTMLYWQHLFKAYHAMLQDNPHRPVIALYNFCGSGGCLKFMEQASYRNYYKTHRWPLFAMASSGEDEGAIPGLLPIFCQTLSQHLASDSSITLEELFAQTNQTFLAQNPCLTTQKVVISSPCLVCRAFQGTEEMLGLCTKCHKEYLASAEAERPDLSLLAVTPEPIHPEDEGEGEHTGEALNHRFKHSAGSPDVATFLVKDLFLNLRGGARPGEAE